MATVEELHDELDRLVPYGTKKRSDLRIMVHMMIDLGAVTEIACARPDCVEDTRQFTSYPTGTARGRNKKTMTIDHITNLCDGGSDRVENLRLLHFSCNSGLGGKNPSPQRRAALSSAVRERWSDPDYRERMSTVAQEIGRRPEVAASRSEKMTARWADPEYRARVSEATSGDRHWTRRPGTEQEPTPCPVCGKLYKGPFGVSNHMKAHKND